MEKSIKRVEKLVQATNSALAQMKFSLMFDDLSGDGTGKSCATKGFDTPFGEAFLDGDDLRRCQSEFNSEANEMLGKMEGLRGSNESSGKNAKAVDRIKEINRKMNHVKMERSKREETERSRQKLVNLLSEERFSPGVASSRDSIRSKQTIQSNREKKPAPKKTDAPVVVTESPNKSTEELRSKILETQEIVNRGFHTARRLAQKVDTMSRCERKEKTPSTEKTASEINLRSPESDDTASTVRCRRCAKKRRTKSEEKVERVGNARVIEVTRKDPERCARSNLRVQRLPSVHIKGGLQMQKIHSLEIPAGGDAACAKSNTAINFLSHERMETEKMGESIDKVRKENACCTGDDARGNYVECFNCGKFVRIRDTRVDPRKVDEILQKCNFDVFDPRIDEFVEKCAAGVDRWKEELPDAVLPPEPEEAPKETGPRAKDPPKSQRYSTLQGLSEKLLKKYRREADTMESNHLKLDNILQNLFRQVDESREVFEKCSLLRNKSSQPVPRLTTTEPVLVSLTGTSFRTGKRERKLTAEKKKAESKEEVEPRAAPLPVETTESGGRLSLVNFNGSRKPDKREVPRGVTVASNDHRSSPRPSEIGKVRRASSVTSSVTSSSTSDSRSCDPLKDASGKEGEEAPSTRHGSTTTASKKEEEQRKTPGALIEHNGKLPEAKKEEFEEEKAPSETSSPSSGSNKVVQTDADKRGTLLSSLFRACLSEAVLGKTDAEKKSVASSADGKAPSETSSEKSENNYESDFESMTNEPNEVVGECEDEEPEVDLGVNKLSTISEVDSELEKKLSDEQRTLRSDRNIETEEAVPKDAEKREGDVRLPVRKEGDSTAVETSSESKKTEATSPRTAEASAKTTPTELVTSLKDILSALQDQFVRTESLAEKLTENARSEARASVFASDSWKKTEDARLVENLRSSRKDSGGSKSRGRSGPPERPSGKSPEEKVASADGLSDEGGSSLGEIVRSDRRRKAADKSESSSISEWIASDGREENSASGFKLDVNSEEVLYSEGEIPSDELLRRPRSSSIGEVISGKNSIASSSGLKDEN